MFLTVAVTVTIGWVGASGAGVGFVEAKFMCPAVVNGDAVIGGDGCWGGSLGGSGGHCGFAVWIWSRFLAQNSGSIGPM